MGNLVWNLKPSRVGGHKIQTHWVGPCRVLARNGGDSYTITTWDNSEKDVHISQLKPCYDDPVVPEGVPLHYFKPMDRPAPPTPSIAEVCGHHISNDGTYRFQVTWEGAPEEMTSWLDFGELAAAHETSHLVYCATHGIDASPGWRTGTGKLILDDLTTAQGGKWDPMC